MESGGGSRDLDEKERSVFFGAFQWDSEFSSTSFRGHFGWDFGISSAESCQIHRTH